jgi:hypothetical protein
MTKGPKILWYDDEECSAGPTKFHSHEVKYVRSDLVDGLVLALIECLSVNGYQKAREMIHAALKSVQEE